MAMNIKYSLALYMFNFKFAGEGKREGEYMHIFKI